MEAIGVALGCIRFLQRSAGKGRKVSKTVLVQCSSLGSGGLAKRPILRGPGSNPLSLRQGLKLICRLLAVHPLKLSRDVKAPVLDSYGSILFGPGKILLSKPTLLSKR